MSRSGGLDGQYGTIPYDAYLRKIEQSNVQEDPMMVENYMRGLLADFRPDPTSLASDEARDPSDRGGGNHSVERLSLRYSGGRSEETPYLPDGTFLDYEFLERDPRGPTGEPNWNEARRQKMARAQFIKFYNDDDLSIKESGINPAQMRERIRNSQQQFKERFKNFEESHEGWTGAALQARRPTSRVLAGSLDGAIVDLTDTTVRNRQDVVDILSNAIKGMPRNTTPDHRIKISRYGSTRPMQSIGSNNWNNNRSNTYLDHSTPVEINGQMINRSIAILIKDLEGQRVNKQYMMQGAKYSDSAVNQQRESRYQLNPEDIHKLVMIGMTSSSHAINSNTKLDTEGTNRTQFNLADVDTRFMLNNTKLDHSIASTMAQSNKAIPKKHRVKLGKNITESAKRQGFFTEQGNNARGGRPGANGKDLKREGLDTRIIEDSRSIKNYGTAIPMKHNNNMEKIDHEKFGKFSRNTMVRAHNYSSKHVTTADHEYDIDMTEFRDVDRREMGPAKFKGRAGNASEYDMDFGNSGNGLNYAVSLEDLVLS
jgi:hypothetical protein